jgi:hypothetical protein
MYILCLTSKIPSLLPHIFLHALLVINNVLISWIHTFKISETFSTFHTLCIWCKCDQNNNRYSYFLCDRNCCHPVIIFGNITFWKCTKTTLLVASQLIFHWSCCRVYSCHLIILETHSILLILQFYYNKWTQSTPSMIISFLTKTPFSSS